MTPTPGSADVDLTRMVCNATNVNQVTGAFRIVNNVTVTAMLTFVTHKLEVALTVEIIQPEVLVTGKNFAWTRPD